MIKITESMKKIAADCLEEGRFSDGKGEFQSKPGHYLASAGYYMLTPWGQIYAPGQPMIMAKDFVIDLLGSGGKVWWFKPGLSEQEYALAIMDQYKFLELQRQITSVAPHSKIAQKLYALLSFWAGEFNEAADGILPFEITHEQIGSVLQVGRVTITRAFGELREQRLVSVSGQYIQVH